MSVKKNNVKQDYVESTFVEHVRCDVCDSEDNNSLYTDGHTHCHVCETTVKNGAAATHKEKKQTNVKVDKNLLEIDIKDIPSRELTRETCQKWNYGVSKYQKRNAQVATYIDHEGNKIAQKVKMKGKEAGKKEFRLIGQTKELPLFGQHLWKEGGKRLIITEGEIDAMSVSQVQEHKWPVVSVPYGAQSALKSIKENLTFVESFQEVVFAFDNDKAGQEAVEECIRVLSPGKAFLVSFELKDANEYLKAGRIVYLVQVLWKARKYKPQGILRGPELSFEDMMEAGGIKYELPWPKLNQKLDGLHKAALTMVAAGSGVGKTTLVAQLAEDLREMHDCKIGNIFLEESIHETAQRLTAMNGGFSSSELKSAVNPQKKRGQARKIYTRGSEEYKKKTEKFRAAFEKVQSENNIFYDHFGSLEADDLLSMMRFMAVSEECDFIILDHISIAVTDTDDAKDGERMAIDRLMTRLRTLIEATGVGVIAIVHLTKPEGKTHEEGGRVTSNQLRGSGSLKQLSDAIIGLERDQQSEDASNQTILRLLKNRDNGELGVCDTLLFNKKTSIYETEDIQLSSAFVEGVKALEEEREEEFEF